MGASVSAGSVGRRRLLMAAGASCLPAWGSATTIYAPQHVAEAYARQVARRLEPPAYEARIYGAIAELHLLMHQQVLWAPQYMLVVDANPHVQAALLMWRLAAGSYEILGASPVSTGGPVRPEHLETPQGVYQQEVACDGGLACRGAGPRVYDFGWQRARSATGRGPLFPLRLQALAAQGRAVQRLGSACSNGCVLLPASLMAFLDRFGVIDAALPEQAVASDFALPYRGRYMLVVDSERDQRPGWSPAPAQPA